MKKPSYSVEQVYQLCLDMINDKDIYTIIPLADVIEMEQERYNVSDYNCIVAIINHTNSILCYE